MAGAIVQFVEASNGAAGTTLGVVITGATVGNSFHVAVLSDDATVTVSDGSNTYGAEKGSVIEAAVLRRLHHFVASVTTGGTLTVTATFGASVSNRQIVVTEISGVGAYDAQGVQTDTGNNPTTAATATNSAQPAFGIAVCIDYQGGTPAVGTGYTSGGVITGGGLLGGRIAYRSFATVAAQTVDFGNAGFDRTCTVFALFLEGGGATPTPLGYISRANHPGRGPGVRRFGLRANPGGVVIATANVTVALTGVSGAGAVGSVAQSRTVPLTQVAGTGAVGTVAQSRTVALTQVAGSGAVGSVAPAISAALTQAAGSGAVGTVAPSNSVALTQVSATGAVGTVTAGSAVTVALTGVSATGSVGTVAPSTATALTQAAGSGAVGTVSPAASVALSQVAGAGVVGALAPSTSVALTQVSGAGAVGTVTTGSDVTVALTGVSAAGVVGNVSPATAVAVTQVSGTGAVGTVATARTVPITGNAAAGAVGTVTPSTAVALTGVSAAGAVGSVAVFSPDVTVALTGVSAVGSVGSVTASGGAAAQTGAPDYGGGGKKKKRYIVQRGEQLLVFTDKADALNMAMSQALPEKAKPKAKKPEPVAQEKIDLPAVKAYAKAVGQGAEYSQAMAAKQYEAVTAMFEQMQDDEDIELLLLHDT